MSAEPGWKIGVGPDLGHLRYAVPDEMKFFRRRISGESEILVWTGHPEFGKKFTVEVRLRTAKSGLVHSRILFRDYEGAQLIREIRFPVISRPWRSGDRVFLPCMDSGVELTDPVADSGHGFECQSAQFILGTSEKHDSFYLDMRDPHHWPKTFSYQIEGDTVCREAIHYLPLAENVTPSFSLPYECCFRDFRGGWYAGAQIYRTWALRQKWVTDRKKPSPLRKIGLWIWNRGLIRDVIPPVLKLREALPDVPLALDWYWWHGNPYDTDYPDFWPPREGEKAFRDAVALLKKKNIYVQVYINGALWDVDNPSWANGGDDSVTVMEDGTNRARMFNVYTKHRLGFICGEAPKFQDRISRLMDQLTGTGLPGVYLDVIGCMINYQCMNPRHKHLKGGGGYMTDGYRALFARLRKEHPETVLSTEYCNEAFMDQLDGVIACTGMSPEHLGMKNTPVPLFQAVYHGKNFPAVFGNYAHPDGIPPWDPLWPAEDRWPEEKEWTKLFPDQFCVEVMRPVLCGIQPMVCTLREKVCTDPAYAEIWNFILRTAEFYHRNLGFLYDGRMLSPDGFRCKEAEVRFHARMIFTKMDKAKVIVKKLPAILHSIWQAPSGKKALFLGNCTAEPQAWEYGTRKGVLAPRSYEKICLN